MSAPLRRKRSLLHELSCCASSRRHQRPDRTERYHCRGFWFGAYSRRAYCPRRRERRL